MSATSVKTIIFEGTKIANLDVLFSKANGLNNDGWQDYFNLSTGFAYSQRVVSGWLNEEDSVIICPTNDTRMPNLGVAKSGLWYRYHGLVSISETFGAYLKHGQHLIMIQPLKSTFDIVDLEEEPEGRKNCYKDFPKYIRDSVNEITLVTP